MGCSGFDASGVMPLSMLCLRRSPGVWSFGGGAPFLLPKALFPSFAFYTAPAALPSASCASFFTSSPFLGSGQPPKRGQRRYNAKQDLEAKSSIEKGASGPSGSPCSRDFGGPWLVRGARLAPSGVSALLEGGQDFGRKAHGPPLLLLYFPFWLLFFFFCHPSPPSVFLISSSLLFFFMSIFCFLFETG